ncbi:MAG: hypothetical protein RLZZ163_1336 [Actinomycetota bacterium]
MATCIIRRAGRLGNQLFEYAALRTWLAAEDRLVLLGFDEAARAVDWIQARTLALTRNRSRAYTALVRTAKLVGSAPVRIADANLVRDGRPQGLMVCEEEYFQEPALIDPVRLGPLRPAASMLRRADRLLRAGLRPGDTPVFVQVRRADYLTWGVAGEPAAVSDDWLWERSHEALQRVPRGRLVLLSDDVPHAVRVLAEFEPIIGSDDAAVDLAVMSRCAAGVLSPSSFAWWGAWFAVHRSQAPGPFLAPRYWVGHATGRWFPPRMESAFLEYSDVGEPRHG